MGAVIQEVRCLTSSVGLSIVHGERSDRQEILPVGVIPINEMPQHFLEYTIGSLSLAICLRVEGRGEAGLDGQALTRQSISQR